MSWNPTYQVTDTRPLAANLLAYIDTHQTAALSWANGGPGLEDFAVIYNTDEGRYLPIFPNLQMMRERHRTDYSNDEFNISYTMEMLFEVRGTDTTALKNQIKRYGYALESIILSIPPDVLTAGITAHTPPQVTVLEIEELMLHGEDNNWSIGSILRVNWQYM